MEAKIPKLEPKRRAFVREYLKDFNGTQAAIRAGYSPRSANVQAAQLLAIPSVKAAVAAGESRLDSKAIATREERQAFWTKTMQTESVEMGHRLRGSELLGKACGDFIEKFEHKVSIGLEEMVLASIEKKGEHE